MLQVHTNADQDTDNSDHARHMDRSRQHSSPGHSSTHQDGPSPFINTGALVPTPVLSHWCDLKIPEQVHPTSHSLQPVASPPQQISTARRMQSIPVREYNPGVFGPSLEPTPTSPSSIDSMYNHSVPTLQTSAMFNSSPQSSSSGISFGISTTPTSIGSSDMARGDSFISGSFHNDIEMIRLDSAASNTTNDQAGLRKDVQLPVQQSFHFTPALRLPTPSANPAHDISLAGAQFNSRRADAAAPNMQRKLSSNSRQLHPKVKVTSPVVCKQPSTSGHDVIRVPSQDGSYKEAIKISPPSSFIRSSSNDKVKCPYLGCAAHPHGFKGMHEMQRHFDRAHKEARQVYVCAPLVDEPDFLSKTNCKHCQTQKRYNEDYNAGEHLRRMHFNPRQPKIRRGQLTDDEKRGGKGGGTEPPMTLLRNYMVTFEVDVNGMRVSEPQKVNPSSNLIVPIIVDGGDQHTDQDMAIANRSSSTQKTNLEEFNSDDDHQVVLCSPTQTNGKTRSASIQLLDSEPAQLEIADDMKSYSQSPGWKSNAENQFPFDPNDPFIQDPLLSDVTSAEYDDELIGFLTSLS